MREVMAVGWKAGDPASVALDEQEVVYRGPFTEVRDEAGRSYKVGERVRLGRAELARLSLGPLADQFVFLRDRT